MTAERIWTVVGDGSTPLADISAGLRNKTLMGWATANSDTADPDIRNNSSTRAFGGSLSLLALLLLGIIGTCRRVVRPPAP